MNVVERWRAATENPEDGELTHREWGNYERHHVEHGWWLHPDHWGLGFEVQNLDWSTGRGDGRLVLVFALGPLSWCLSLCRPLTFGVL